MDELRLAASFRERGCADLAHYVIEGRKYQRFFFALGTESSFLSTKELIDLFKGLWRAFSFEDEEWESWKRKALENWKDDGSLLRLLEL
ncbi:hypothetical protein N7495_001788 [Penicillium taxi]|uniref:uncharacterized protein n=1 Tax=Penicillium taxi TaxID=168475 RepID=UPI002545681D|nr:uncharacterized protein N7495_001788 [Penicillium taxi]KAJ5909106.1 hypothetical protein N7495_001788 [Penicillium taxi]